LTTPKRNAKEVDRLICPSCGCAVFKLIRDEDEEIEWAICVECDGYTVVTHLEVSQDDYEQKRRGKS